MRYLRCGMNRCFERRCYGTLTALHLLEADSSTYRDLLRLFEAAVVLGVYARYATYS